VLTAETLVVGLSLVLVAVVANTTALADRARVLLLLLALVASVLAALHRKGTL